MANIVEIIFELHHSRVDLRDVALMNRCPAGNSWLDCMAMVEYFAFEAQRTNDTAITNFRNLARFGLQKFIYDALGYVPEDPWKLFNARVSLLKDSVPVGYFSVFKESTGLVVDLINAGVTVNQHTIGNCILGKAETRDHFR